MWLVFPFILILKCFLMTTHLGCQALTEGKQHKSKKLKDIL